MEAMFLGAALFLATAVPPQPPDQPIAPARAIERSIVRLAREDARMLTAHRGLRRTFSQPPLRMSSPRATRGAIVALGAIVGMTVGAHVAEEMRENAWGYGLPIGAALGGIVAYLVTQ
jgi:hypothetical protein